MCVWYRWVVRLAVLVGAAHYHSAHLDHPHHHPLCVLLDAPQPRRWVPRWDDVISRLSLCVLSVALVHHCIISFNTTVPSMTFSLFHSRLKTYFTMNLSYRSFPHILISRILWPFLDLISSSVFVLFSHFSLFFSRPSCSSSQLRVKSLHFFFVVVHLLLLLL